MVGFQANSCAGGVLAMNNPVSYVLKTGMTPLQTESDVRAEDEMKLTRCVCVCVCV